MAKKKKAKKDQDLYAIYANGEVGIFQGRPTVETRLVVTNGNLLTTLCKTGSEILKLKPNVVTRLTIGLEVLETVTSVETH